ncbi:unnamed protein product [Effrenium voratum]|uniref:Uncharacterized protein n=1 Tax=Effrenium voratum TaxID=2562239 RepID=A0AA36N1D9_9DINO|nr:unnamed protein product [Effrenium voratum]
MEFFKEHAVKDKTDTEIVKVVIGWDIDEWRENISRLKASAVCGFVLLLPVTPQTPLRRIP